MNRKVISRKALVLVFSALAIAGASGSVLAGQKSENTVTVTSTTASGSLGTARSSADTNQMIQCTVKGFSTQAAVSCAARDAAGNYFSCTAYSTTLATAAAGIGPNSRLYIVANSSGACTQIDSTNGSYYKPVVP
jgi:hypothetical protein